MGKVQSRAKGNEISELSGVLLPDEILVKEIFSFLSRRDLQTVSCICRHWNLIISSYKELKSAKEKPPPPVLIPNHTFHNTEFKIVTLGDGGIEHE